MRTGKTVFKVEIDLGSKISTSSCQSYILYFDLKIIGSEFNAIIIWICTSIIGIGNKLCLKLTKAQNQQTSCVWFSNSRYNHHRVLSRSERINFRCSLPKDAEVTPLRRFSFVPTRSIYSFEFIFLIILPFEEGPDIPQIRLKILARHLRTPSSPFRLPALTTGLLKSALAAAALHYKSLFPGRKNVTPCQCCKIDLNNSMFYKNLHAQFVSKIFLISARD